MVHVLFGAFHRKKGFKLVYVPVNGQISLKDLEDVKSSHCQFVSGIGEHQGEGW